MIGQESRDVERKVVAILRVLSDSTEPLGGRVIARRLNDLGIDLGERAVRYHLKLMDERGLTHPVRRKDGRSITEKGIEELKSALVSDRVGSMASRIALLAYRTSYNPESHTGEVPVNISLFCKEMFEKALAAMADAFRAGLCVSELVAVAAEGERLGEVIVPQGKVGLATVSTVLISGVLLKAGIPLDSRFAGILQVRDQKPLRFVDLIEYSGCSLDPAEMFVASRMTRVGGVVTGGDGKILASLGETPAACRPTAETVIARMERAGFGGLIMMGEMGEPVCETPVDFNKVGIVLQSGLNPVAAAVEAGIEVVNRAMGGVIDCGRLRGFWEL